MENKKKVVAFVPMKLNNERLPGKNTKAFKGGKPLLTYILDTLTKVEGIDETYVYCSNEEVKKYLPNGIKFLKRSESLDTSSTLIIDVLKAFAEDVDADIYVLAHATAPFIKAKTIETAIDIQEQYYASIGMPIGLKELGVKEEDLAKLALDCSRNKTRSLIGYKPLAYEDILVIYQMAYERG